MTVLIASVALGIAGSLITLATHANSLRGGWPRLLVGLVYSLCISGGILLYLRRLDRAGVLE